MNIIILLDMISYTHSQVNPAFRHMQMKGHIQSAQEFKKSHSNAHLVTKNHKKELNDYLDNADEKPILIVYCGHGAPGCWCIGISRRELISLTKSVSNDIMIVSDCCFSDSMAIERKNTIFISAARTSGAVDNTSAFFTFDGGYLSCTFYKVFQIGITYADLKERILSHYFDEGIDGENLHMPRFYKK